MATITKGIKLRLYPNRQQQVQLWQMFGNSRFVWNQMLNMAKQRYQNNPSSQFIGEYGMNYLLKPLKQEYPFLKVSDSTSYLVVTHNLALAFKQLFKHQGGYPKFKAKSYAKQSYTGRSKCRIIAKRRMKLPKLGEIRTSKTGYLQNCRIKQYTLSYDATGKYYLSLQVEAPQPKPLPQTGQAVGLDVGIADLVISSDGTKYATFNAKWYEKQAKAALTEVSIELLFECANIITNTKVCQKWILATIRTGNERSKEKPAVKLKSLINGLTIYIS